MVGAGIEPHDRVRLDVGDHQLLFDIGLVAAGLIDLEAQFLRGNPHIVAGDGIEHQPAGVEHQLLRLHRAGARDGQLLRHACASEGDVDKVVARLEFEGRRAAFGGRQQRQLAVIAGNGVEDAPGQALLQRLATLDEHRLHLHASHTDRGLRAGFGGRVIVEVGQVEIVVRVFGEPLKVLRRRRGGEGKAGRQRHGEGADGPVGAGAKRTHARLTSNLRKATSSMIVMAISRLCPVFGRPNSRPIFTK